MRILTASQIDPATLETLREEHDVVSAIGVGPEELRSLVADREAVIFRSGVTLSADVMRQAPDLRLLIRAGSGFDNVDLDYVRQHGIEFTRIPEPGAKAVAEMAFALMLSLARNVVRADGLLRRGRWAKHEMTGHGVRGKVLGIVGCGNIGSRVGRLGAAWDMTVLGNVEHPRPQARRRLAEQGIGLTDFDEVLSRADYLSLHVPLKDSTQNLIDETALAKMKPGAFLINLARGGVVDEAALKRSLTRPGGLAGAALDVHAAEGEGRISPLADLPNVILTPHIGAGTRDAQREIGLRIQEIINAHGSRQRSIAGHAEPHAYHPLTTTGE